MEGAGGTAEGTASWPLAEGTSLGKYRIVRFLGEGGMGAVYEGLHVEIGKRVAIKLISPALADIPEARARFLLEAQLTSRVRHPHTVDVTDIGTEGGRAFLVMEYLEGEDLAKHLRRHGPLPFDQVVDIALPTLAAVAAAHQEGIVHRDLKPQNIFLTKMPDGTIHPKVLDFGISKAPASEHSPVRTSGVMLGSPSYFAPEQVQDPKAISPASDQYALGVILYECVTGRLPYEGSNLAAIFQAIVMGTCQPARVYRPDLPEPLARIIAKAMSIEPGDRYLSVISMGRDLLELASPRTRLLWESHFALPSPAWVVPRSSEGHCPVPVTDQTPGPTPSPLSVTASMPGNRQPEVSTVDRAPGWIPPTRSHSPAGSDSSLVVPRRFRPARWIGGGVIVAVVGLIGVITFHNRSQAPPPVAAPLAAPPARAKAPPRIPAAVEHGARDGEPVEKTASVETVEQPGPEPTAQKSRRGRPAHRARFGPNRAPLIE
jgi:eukaryotic-like serine/threonine-protein kinase